MNQAERRIFMIKQLLEEEPQYYNVQIPESPQKQKNLLRALMNVRSPKPISSEFLRIQDEYLSEETAGKGITDINDLSPVCDGIYLWQGDITTLRCDAIVNAANSGMTGCYHPLHSCIDNCIHSYSGIQLRMACAELIEEQGYHEPSGRAKMTPAFNLPCRNVIHTVGPIVYGNLTDRECELLESCYRSCLDLAETKRLESIAFCCISTGEFRFPNEKAAEIAVRRVQDFIKSGTSIRRVIFNVFKDYDREIYARLLGAD